LVSDATAASDMALLHHLTCIVRGLASSTLGSTSESTPSFSSAAILFWSILLGSRKLRE
jgi:hypothetical protein